MNYLDHKKIGFFGNNPVLSLALGLTTALAVTGSVTTAVGMGILVFVLVVLAGVLGGLLRSITPSEMAIPVGLVLSAFLAKLGELVALAYMPSIASEVGIFVPLMAANSLLLLASGALNEKTSFGENMKNALLAGCAYVVALLAVAVLRELAVTGGIALLNPMSGAEIFSFSILSPEYTLSLFAGPTGALLMTALVGGLFQAIGKSGSDKGGK